MSTYGLNRLFAPRSIAVIGGILISMVLSLIVTPAVFFYLGKKRTTPVEAI